MSAVVVNIDNNDHVLVSTELGYMPWYHYYFPLSVVESVTRSETRLRINFHSGQKLELDDIDIEDSRKLIDRWLSSLVRVKEVRP